MKKYIVTLLACAALPLGLAAQSTSDKAFVSTPPITPELAQLSAAISEQDGNCMYVKLVSDIRRQENPQQAAEKAQELFKKLIALFESQIDDSQPQASADAKKIVAALKDMKEAHSHIAKEIKNTSVNELGEAMQDFVFGYELPLLSTQITIHKKPYETGLGFVLHEIVNHKYEGENGKEYTLAQITAVLEKQFVAQDGEIPCWMDNARDFLPTLTAGPLACVE